jgi:CBS domain-containing protein
VREAAVFMADHHVGALLVMERDQTLGIVTERDFLTKVLITGADPSGTPVSEVMARDLVVVTPETPVKEAMRVMTERRCRHLPVLEEGRLVGLVSIGDCTRWVSRDQEYTIRHLTEYIHNRYPG